MEHLRKPQNYEPFGLLHTHMEMLRLLSKVLREYKNNGKTSEQFEEEYGCDLIFDKTSTGITDIKFHNDSNETMFMLKYNNASK